ncbi:hypothetical protein VOWphi5012_075 [Vibrio phage phi50-12]|uniref:Uncharacterized protein n=1 Tax=Vibrio phage phi50-12 TaxID=2654972 RepID=A0A5P8PRG4_9CAUD|nr:hypothetical protein KNU82_gp075 [Vibrio phage phi50-12]QFR59859.1 hypothetical protein VOWphi5012_075 [Vibrio phage phi50-12]
MLKRYLIQLEPSKFAKDIQVIDLMNLRKPITVLGMIAGGELCLKFLAEETDNLALIIKVDSAPIETLYPREYTLIMEKEYVEEIPNPT